MSDIDFRDTLLKLRDKVGHSEHYWKQGNEEKAKETLQELSDIADKAANYHFSDVETIREVDDVLKKIVETKEQVDE